MTRIEALLADKVKFKKENGPFFKSLDLALATLHVERQTYHGGTFVGNHVHKMLQVILLYLLF